MGWIDDTADWTMRKWYRLLRKEMPAVVAAYESLPGLTTRGFVAPGGGAHLHVDAPIQFQGMSTQVAGLWPFSNGTSSPLIGAPLGRDQTTGQPLLGDPLSLFLYGIMSAPSAFILALNGRGKSSLVVRICLGVMDLGFIPLFLGDLKPDYVGLVKAVGGQHIRLGLGGVGRVNALDAGPIAKWLHRLSPQTRTEVEGQIHGRRVNTVAGLIEMMLRRRLSEEQSEHMVLSTAIRVAAEEAAQEGRQPELADVRRVIVARHPRIREAILDMSEAEYDAEVKSLVKGITALGPEGVFGGMFWGQTTVEMDMYKPVVFDVSSIDEGEADLRAAAQLVIWSYGQAGALAAQTLANEPDPEDPQRRLGPEVHHLNVMDELWQILQAWEGSVYRINTITKVNRQKGLGQIMITHSMKDLELSTTERTKMAFGFVERSSMVFLGGLAENEQEDLRRIRRFSDREIQQLVEWSAEGTVNPATGEMNPPPGRGRFLLKTSDAPGIPFRVELTRREKEVHDTNAAWANAIAAARGEGAAA
ncbi:hypothetical protein [Sinomonas sp. ASV322]|uniref:hypothetical protein n=1 Tax=Sinomonas sp. ASV322 TaxID=3041920 RepID=UPI0027DD7180|nr:hypothetical protein [Sinomonas sp. ASV322]MDQ4504450.1 hypothetical protein [Sinomonas sp. ASV322]